MAKASFCFKCFRIGFRRDKRGAGDVVLWNAFKPIAKPIAADYSTDEKRDLFHNSAARAYRITTYVVSRSMYNCQAVKWSEAP